MAKWTEIDPESPERFWWKAETRWPQHGPKRVVVRKYSDKSVVIVRSFRSWMSGEVLIRNVEDIVPRSSRSTVYFSGWHEARQKCLELIDAHIADLQSRLQSLIDQRRVINNLAKNASVGEEEE